MSAKSLAYLKVNLWELINGTIAKVNAECIKREWDGAWFKTYKELGGRSQNSGEKGCPKNAAYFLFKFGRIKGSKISVKPLPDNLDILNEYGKNALYAKISLELLINEKSLDKSVLWTKVQEKYKKATGKEPAKNDAGAATVIFKIIHNNKVYKRDVK